MKKGKRRNRQARVNILRRDAANARRKAGRQPAGKGYDKHSYDKPLSEES
jgi:hypothetical protein